jgi:hypothetical protein
MNVMNSSADQISPSYLGISLWISSTELPPERITQIVGLQPTYARVRGTTVPGRGVNRRSEFDVHEWQFRKQLNIEPGDYIGKHSEQFITQFLDEIKNSTPQIRELSEHHTVMISLVYHVDELPSIGLTRQQVQAIAALGAKLDYDLMVA